MSYQVHNSRGIPPRGAPRKRKERDDGSEPLGFMRPPSAPTAAKPPTTPPAVSSNRLLAGYMAYEFITRGTLLGQECCSAVPAELRRVVKPVGAEPVKERETGSGEAAVQDRYAEVASILKTEGAHIPGIVNPTQLARWIQM
uniref:uncharacterized protein LOC105350929 n=1 Tax=Fragaria vesca subsp. vesca TaxID=101020 RepID=UPI0005C81938|nr:PREDICTED: uncharacterized protein LOC105350929 [Fragaria vesca subsp. vesca]